MYTIFPKLIKIFASELEGNFHRTFYVIQKYAISLNEILLFEADLNNGDFSLKYSAFSLQKTICLRGRIYNTLEGTMALFDYTKHLKYFKLTNSWLN